MFVHSFIAELDSRFSSVAFTQMLVNRRLSSAKRNSLPCGACHEPLPTVVNDNVTVPALISAAEGEYVPVSALELGENTPVPHLPRHPAQLYESIAFFSIAFLLHILWKRNVETGKWHLGKGLGLTFILTFSARFLIEFLKIEQSDFEKGMILNMGQILSIPFVLVGAYLFFVNIEKIKGFDFLTKVKAKQKIKTTVKSKPKVTKNKKNRKKKRK